MKLNQYRQIFESRRANFLEIRPTLQIRFNAPPSQLHDPVPDISYTYNQAFLRYRDWLKTSTSKIEELDVHNNASALNQQVQLLETMQREQNMLDILLEEAWRKEIIASLGPPGAGHPNTLLASSKYSVFQQDQDSDSIGLIARSANFLKVPSPVVMCLLTVVILNIVPGLSREACNFVLLMLRNIVEAACISYVHQSGISLPSSFPNPLSLLGGESSWPLDLRTALSMVSLDSETVVFACCPQCYKLHSCNTEGVYPRECDHQEYPGKPLCGAALTKASSSGPVPILPFLFQPVENWLSRMLSRPGFVDMIDKESKKARKHTTREPADKMKDIFSGTAFQGLEGPDGKLFLDHVDGELRLAFTLNIDWFNPFGKKRSGRTQKVGGIYMVCHNLPVHLRYRPENIYLVGIIPGPGEPDVDQMNQIMIPIVDNFRQLYKDGVRITGLGQNYASLLVRCALIALVCDLPAARKVAGFMGHSAKAFFCSFCTLSRQDLAQIENITPRSLENHLRDAIAHRDAPTPSARAAVLAETGIRWSELLRLPYWNPIESTVVDSMHNLFLGNMKTLCRDIWGMDAAFKGHKSMTLHTPEQQQVELGKIRDAIQGGHANPLKRARKSYLQHYIALNGIAVQETTVNGLVQGLLKWVSKIFLVCILLRRVRVNVTFPATRASF